MIKHKSYKQCAPCNGSGMASWGDHSCPVCDGKGVVEK